jgi:hypothetical protein
MIWCVLWWMWCGVVCDRFTALMHSTNGEEQLVPGHAVVMQVAHLHSHMTSSDNLPPTCLHCFGDVGLPCFIIVLNDVIVCTVGRKAIQRASLLWKQFPLQI